MPQEFSHVALPRDLLHAIDAAVGPRQRRRFVAKAVSRALREQGVRRSSGDPELESWWPLEDMDFVLLESGETWFTGDEE